ncbi:MAG: DUF6089 family protein [Reichenbachiella sp.]|uniref:DUF6089 family protein n=1 Tax=Reichenbachiella sp. TaxID=2184521 RepID=UPI003262E38B
MRKNLLITFILLLVISCTTDSYGQKRRYGYNKSKNKKYSNYSGGRTSYKGVGNTKYWTVGFSLNAMNYFGDLSPTPKKLSTDLSFTRAGFGVTGSRMVYPGIFLRLGYNFGSIKGDDFSAADPTGDNSSRGRYARNLHFKNNIHELSIGFEADLIPNNGGARGRFPINPYMFVGVAVFSHAPKAIAPATDQAGTVLEQAGEWVDLRDLGTEGQQLDTTGLSPYGKFSFAIPVGLGVKVRLPGNFDLNVEVGLRKLFTDYIDDVSGNYVDLALFDDPLARAMSERGGEAIAAMEGETRDTQYYNAADWAGYYVGENYSPTGESPRGGSSDNDMYLVTQLRLVYIFDQKGVTRGKFR